MADASPYEVYAVCYGRLRAPKSEFFYRYSSYGEPDAEVEMAYWFWLLRRGDETIVVDCGFAPEVGARRGRTCLQAPPDALRALGVEPESVSTLLVTHLHYDHIGNLAAFPAATLIIARNELDFWSGPLARRFQFASLVEESEIAFVAGGGRRGSRATDRRNRGDRRRRDGDRSRRPFARSADHGRRGARTETSCSRPTRVHFYEELEFDRPFSVVGDLVDMYATYDVLRELARAGAKVVPGHDPEVARRYPRVQAAGDVEAVRIG